MAKLIDTSADPTGSVLRRLRRARSGRGSLSAADLQEITETLEGGQFLYRQLAEGLQEVLWIGTPDWKSVLYVNPAYERLWGRSCESLYDEPLSWLEAVVDEDRDQVRADIEHKVASGVGEPDFIEYRVTRPDGSVRCVMARAFPILDSAGEVWRVVGLAVDVTSRKEAQEHALRAERDYSTLARNLPGIVYRAALGEGNRMQFYNDAVRSLTGYSAGDLDAGEICSIDPLILEEDRPRVVAEVRRAVREHRPFEIDYRIRHANGDVRHFSERGQPVYGDDGAPLHIDGVILDVTTRARAEEALRAARDELEGRVRERTAEVERRAEQLARLTSELTLTEQRERRRLGQLLHDHLQQLLVGARFGLNVLRGRVGEEAKVAVLQIEGLIEQALDASRDLTVELSPPILHEAGLAAGLEWLGRRMRREHGLVVEVELDDAADPGREDLSVLLFEGARELLLNVVKHARATSARVRLECAGEDGLRVVVADAGVGFDLDGSTRVRPAQGLGLFGLRERLGLLGGDLEIDSRPGGGTRVAMIVPRLAVGPKDETAAAEGGPSDPAADGDLARTETRGAGTIRVLLVDDHVVMRQGLSLLLEEHRDLEVVGEASDGEEGVELARRLRPDVILMDVSMPKLNGIEATRSIHAELPQIRVIGLSMYEEQDRADAMRGAGAAAYLTKTGDPAVLLATIRRVCREDPRRRDGAQSEGD